LQQLAGNYRRAVPGAYPFDAIVIGGGMYGAYFAEKL